MKLLAFSLAGPSKKLTHSPRVMAPSPKKSSRNPTSSRKRQNWAASELPYAAASARNTKGEATSVSSTTTMASRLAIT